jgi:hypothetical protein
VSSENHLLHVAWSPVADRRQEKDEHTLIWRQVTLGVQKKKNKKNVENHVFEVLVSRGFRTVLNLSKQ